MHSMLWNQLIGPTLARTLIPSLTSLDLSFSEAHVLNVRRLHTGDEHCAGFVEIGPCSLRHS